ncbi:MAG: hypothetical protein ACP5K5_00310 [Candidatus Micrarchaeia archaeon]
MNNRIQRSQLAGDAHKKVSETSDYYKFFLLKPKANADARELAKKLISFDEVAEVYVTEGIAGFMVKAKFFSSDMPNSIERYIKSRIGEDYGVLISPLQYRKSQG